MHTSQLKLVTVVGETIIMEDIAARGVSLGATGYTLTEVTGRGSRGVRNVMVTGTSKTMRLEFVVPADIAETVLSTVARHYFEHYACIAWMTDVQVWGGEAHLSS